MLRGRRQGQRLHGRVVHDLGKRIVSGEFAAGAALPAQDACCELVGVSRSVLREALRVLAAKGLVEARPKAGTFVTPRETWNFLDSDVLEWRLATADSEKVVDQLYELRQMVEPVAAAVAASRAKLTDFQRMGQAFDEMSAAADKDEAIAADIRFHRAIIAASGNDLFTSLGRVVEAALLTIFRLGADNPHGQQHSLEMHRAILDAIVERDGNAARLAMQKLIEYSRDTVLAIRAKAASRGTSRATATKPKRRKTG